MKKALVLLLALSMVFGAFADEPVANVNVSEFSGEASVTWGVDLDAERTGFSNSAKATLKLNLIDGGDKTSTGEGVWGEIKIKTDGDTFAKAEGDDALALPGLKVKVDAAKLHFGENAYIGITSGDTQVGEYKLDTAVAAEQIKNENVGDKDYKNGIVAGYGNDLFSVDVDFRSADIKTKDATYVKVAVVTKDGVYIGSNGQVYIADEGLNVGDVITKTKDGNVTKYVDKASEASQYSNMYSFAIDGSLKVVENLTLKGGYSADFANKWDETLETGFYVATDYKLGLNDTFYLKPQVGYAHAITNDNAEKATVENNGNLVAAVLFGWGDKADSKPDVYFLDSDNKDEGKNSKKVTPGISLAMSKQLIGKQEFDGDIVYKGVKSPTSLAVSFFSGEIVENLTAAAYYATTFGEKVTEDKDGNETKVAEYEGYEFAAGLKYKLAVGEGSITPQFGIAMANEGFAGTSGVINYTDKAAADEDVLNIKVGAEFAGYVENTTFSVVYASNNLKDDDNAGTLNFTCKIAL